MSDQQERSDSARSPNPFPRPSSRWRRFVAGRRVSVVLSTIAILGLMATVTVGTGFAAWSAVTRNNGSTFATDSLTPPTNLVATAGTPATGCAGPGGSQVHLTWTASGSPSTAGYSLFRGTVSGGPYVLAGSVVGAGTTSFNDNAPRLANGNPVAYTANYADNTVTPFNTTTHATSAPIAVGAGPGGALPAGDGMAITLDNTKVYETNFNGNSITPITVATNTAGANIALGAGTGPDAVVFTPDGLHAYVGNYGNNTVRVITVATNALGASIATGAGTRPQGIAITPDGKTVYVANAGGSLGVINTATNTLTTTITDAWTELDGIAVTPDGKTVWVADDQTNQITPVAVATNTPGAKLTVGNNAQGIAISPNGCFLYVSNFNSNTVSPVNLTNNTVGAAVAVGTGPTAMAFTPDGATLFVANYTSGNVTPITVATNTAGAAFLVGSGAGSQPDAICVSPWTANQKYYYVAKSTVFNWSSGNSNEASVTLP